MRSTAFKPVGAHVHGFGGLGDHGVHGESVGGVVISGDGSGARLRMSHFFECCAEWDRGLATVEECGKLGFGSGGHDMFDDGGQDKNGTVVEVRAVLFREVHVCRGSALGVGLREVRGICIHCQYHIAGVVSNGGIGVSSTVV